MLLKTITAVVLTKIWPPTRRRWKEAEIARLRSEQKAEARIKTKALRAEQKRREAERCVQEYNEHVRAVDLTGLVERRGRPLKVSEIEGEVMKRKELAARAQDDPHMCLTNTMLDEAIAANFDQASRHFLLDHADPDRQRKTAKAVMDARADLDPIPSIRDYATAVANLVASERIEDGDGNDGYRHCSRDLAEIC